MAGPPEIWDRSNDAAPPNRGGATRLQTSISAERATVRTARSGFFDIAANPDLFATCAVAAIGLLLTLALARLYPVSDALILIGQMN